MASDIRNIGFIGLGSMGGDQVRELVKLGRTVTVFDAFPAAMARFEGKAVLAANIAEVGRAADVVGICVQDDAQVMTCVDELLPAMKAGSVLLIHSTVRPATMIEIGGRATLLGIEVLDASVTRTEMTKDGPFVFCMTGGSEEAAARVADVLAAFSTNTMHVGPLGSAMALKICNNLVSWSSIMISLEAVAIAEAAGVPMDKLLTVMKRNGVMTPPGQGFVEFRNNRGDEAKKAMFAVQAGIGQKDLALAVQLADEAGAPSPIAAFARDLVKPEILKLCS